MTIPRVFISYAQKDASFIQQLYTRISSLKVRCWNYQSREEEIPTGSQIPDVLIRQIDGADIFLPVITPSSIKSPWVELEVSHALSRVSADSRQVIWPLVFNEVKPSEIDGWPSQDWSLSQRKWQGLDQTSSADLEKAILAFCKEFDLEYVPPTTDHVRFRFMSRFLQEVKDKCPRNSEYGIGIYHQLMIILSQFSESVLRDDFRTAIREIQYFIAVCEHEFPNLEFYFPYVSKGVCELELDDIDAAQSTFSKLLDNPLLDENIFGALGWIRQHLGDFPEAVRFYREAMARDPNDFAAKLNYCTSAIMCGIRDPEFEIDKLIAEVSQHEDELRLLGKDPDAIRAFLLGHSGRSDEAKAIYYRLIKQKTIKRDDLFHFCSLLEYSGRIRDALRLLKRTRKNDSSPAVTHRLARYLMEVGKYKAACGLFESLAADVPCNRQYHIEAAVCHWKAGNRRESLEFAQAVLVEDRFGLPATQSDFYYEGFAQWIFGNRTLAEYDFERSGFDDDFHYRFLSDP